VVTQKGGRNRKTLIDYGFFVRAREEWNRGDNPSTHAVRASRKIMIMKAFHAPSQDGGRVSEPRTLSGLSSGHLESSPVLSRVHVAVWGQSPVTMVRSRRREGLVVKREALGDAAKPQLKNRNHTVMTQP
jgi:hypothetical protein